MSHTTSQGMPVLQTKPAHTWLNLQWYCPCCGSIWAESFTAATEWFPMRAVCAECSSPFQHDAIPGSLWNSLYHIGTNPYSHLPRPLLIREVEVLTKGQELMAPELMLRAQELRTKAVSGTITDVELAEAVKLLREGRTQAARASSKSKGASTGPKMSGDDVLSLFAV